MTAAWYLRRAVPWPALLGALACASVAAGVLDRWPEAAPVLAPTTLGAAAAAAAFAFDEPVASIAAVAPRSQWARTTRLLVLLGPLAVWGLLVWARPGGLPLDRPSWWLAGAAAITLTAGLAALVSRTAGAAPGSELAALVVVAALAPVLVGMFLGWGSIYPIGEVPAGVTVFWSTLGAAGLLLGAVALRPGVSG